ncbi:MAG: hypothetical protein HYR96_14220 [Deltaproteobacteria bacterium]|nr:hypothetical protein [Deltaproteobacteria bacterium]MBI3296408.1 hypothetical protein [Deltaproteobacteria bacterium]
MLKWIRCIQWLALGLLLSACGNTGRTTVGVPTPTPLAGPVSSPIPTPGANLDSRIPDLSRAVGVNLTDVTSFSALRDMAINVFPPLVGNPLLQLTMSASRATDISGSLLFGFEDQYGFWGAQQVSFPGTGYQSDTVLDVIFADDSLVTRVSASRFLDNLSGTLYYRIRSSGDTACKQQYVTCTVIGFPGSGTICPTAPDTVVPCQNYMSPSDTHVKKVGTFSAKFSKWTTITGGN